jgi:Zn-finger nucleic acid-binding protein
MEPVILEGDFNNYFDLFCERGMQQEARYALDPKAMAFVLDFCQSENWEIVSNQLYLVVASGMGQDPNDTTNLQEDIPRFVAEIRPALQTPLSNIHQATLTPYGQDRRTDLRCPICKKTLVKREHFFSCPDGDGILVDGATLQQIKQGKIVVPTEKGRAAQRQTSLACPSCGKQMAQVAYNGGPTIIDSCTHCPYRWLDAGEIG